MVMDFFEPRISADTAQFWEGCRQHKLIFQKCEKCKKVRWPASYVCPECLSSDVSTVELAPTGTLYSYIILEKPFHPSLADKVPYVVGEVDLEEGVRITVNVDATPDQLRCGAPVEIRFCDSETYSRPVAYMKQT